ncbi:HxlR family transcriptional regulator [Herbihabitans rhizosphaerae]|uniref:HxlR family transcriptional regulator n=1 Tax=Herbihabitans rhizosphaerae TaxID=1872711 RepID=A0A4Q7KP65_9PSEU|nr:winged helix-turn-helix transcriptional regulator [Herbihabitans rhizosphaerae]RZS37780.1 HxlR family transcriptional regulator [Herbihabitans rhizosphaerae]
MRSYGQFCAVARALDVIGDRWTPLIVRELLLGPRRFTELQRGLPGIATNLLATRLTTAQEQGIVEHDGAVYRLSPDGEALRPLMREAVRWGMRHMGEIGEDDAFRSRWLVLALRVLLTAPDGTRATVLIESGDEPIVVTVRDGRLDVDLGDTDSPDAVVGGPPDAVLNYLTGAMSLTAARRHGVRITGDRKAVAALRTEEG